jgi:hypothetical protein
MRLVERIVAVFVDRNVFVTGLFVNVVKKLLVTKRVESLS